MKSNLPNTVRRYTVQAYDTTTGSYYVPFEVVADGSDWAIANTFINRNKTEKDNEILSIERVPCKSGVHSYHIAISVKVPYLKKDYHYFDDVELAWNEIK